MNRYPKQGAETSPTWEVSKPDHLLTAAIEATIERLDLGPIHGWAKKGTGLEVTAGLPKHPYSRTVEIGPRGGIRRDSLAEWEREKERKAAAAARARGRERGASAPFVYDRAGNLVGLRFPS
jgi:hypothetical protein